MPIQLSLQQRLNQRLAELRKSQSQQPISKQAVPLKLIDFQGKTWAEIEGNLVLAASLYIADKNRCYMDYMRLGFKLWSVLVREGEQELQHYCTKEAPDVCVCGRVFSAVGFRLRDHCYLCEGKGASLRLDYEIQRFSMRFNIHPTWVCWAFTKAVYNRNRKLKKSKV